MSIFTIHQNIIKALVHALLIDVDLITARQHERETISISSPSLLWTIWKFLMEAWVTLPLKLSTWDALSSFHTGVLLWSSIRFSVLLFWCLINRPSHSCKELAKHKSGKHQQRAICCSSHYRQTTCHKSSRVQHGYNLLTLCIAGDSGMPDFPNESSDGFTHMNQQVKISTAGDSYLIIPITHFIKLHFLS